MFGPVLRRIEAPICLGVSLTHPVLLAFLFTLPAVVAAALGGGAAAWRPPGDRTTSAIQHFAAGLVFAATALELLPKERSGAALPVIIGFAVGLVLMLLVRHIAHTIEAREQDGRNATGLVVVTGLDLAIDGLVLGIAFASGEKTGLLLAAALTLEVLFLSLSAGVALLKSGASRRRAALVPPALALLLSAFAALGRAAFGGLGPFAFTALIGVGTVALLYLVTEELLVEAHEVEETPLSISAFFVGFLAFLLMEMWVEA